MTQELSDSGYPFQLARYWHWCLSLCLLLAKISLTSYSSWPSIVLGTGHLKGMLLPYMALIDLYETLDECSCVLVTEVDRQLGISVL